MALVNNSQTTTNTTNNNQQYDITNTNTTTFTETHTTSNTTLDQSTTVGGDIGLTGSDAVAMAKVINEGGVAREMVFAESFQSLLSTTGNMFSALMGGGAQSDGQGDMQISAARATNDNGTGMSPETRNLTLAVVGLAVVSLLASGVWK